MEVLDNLHCFLIGDEIEGVHPLEENSAPEDPSEIAVSQKSRVAKATRWKQIVAYEYTSNSFAAEEMQEKLYSVISRAHKVGLQVRPVISVWPKSRILASNEYCCRSAQ